MAGRLNIQKRFSTPESRQKLVKTVRTQGIDETMRVYNIKNRARLIQFIGKLVADGYFSKSSILSGMSGGEKHKYLREHRDTILDLMETQGKDFVMEAYCLGEKTLRNLEGQPAKVEYKKVTHAEAAELKSNTALNALEALELVVKRHERRLEQLEHILSLHTTRIERAEEGSRANAIEVRQQRDAYDKFVPTVSNAIGSDIGKRITIAIALLLRTDIPLDRAMEIIEKPDPMSLEALIPVEYKRKQRQKALKENPLFETIEKLARK